MHRWNEDQGVFELVEHPHADMERYTVASETATWVRQTLDLCDSVPDHEPEFEEVCS